MEKLYNKITEFLKNWITILLYLLCLGVIVQLLIDEPLMGWDPVGNIKDAGASFIGVIALIVMYLLFNKKQN